MARLSFHCDICGEIESRATEGIDFEKLKRQFREEGWTRRKIGNQLCDLCKDCSMKLASRPEIK